VQYGEKWTISLTTRERHPQKMLLRRKILVAELCIAP
jgi:hypothetical protein